MPGVFAEEPATGRDKPPAERIEEDVALAALADGELAEEESPGLPAPGPPAHKPAAERIEEGMATTALPEAGRVEEIRSREPPTEGSQLEIRSEPARQRVIAALTEAMPPVDTVPEP